MTKPRDPKLARRIQCRIAAYTRYAHRRSAAPRSWIVSRIKEDLCALGVPEKDHLIYVMNRYREPKLT